MKKILALTAAAALAVTSIGCTKHEGSTPEPPATGTAPANTPAPEGTTPAPETGTAPAPTEPAPAEGKAP
jgi:hypothetical protein